MEEGQEITGAPDTGFGASLALSATQLVVGAPDAASGSAFTYENDDGTFSVLEELTGSNPESLFGYAVDASNLNSVIIGAPETNPAGRSISTGAAFFFNYNPGSRSWALQGSPIQGGLLVDNANERFGEAVAISSSVDRAVIGAPQFASGAGRVYMFELVQGEWQVMDQQELLGRSTAAGLGSAVDMSEDGTVVAVGSPGNDGLHIYEWIQGQWTRTLKESGPAGSAMGTSVAVLANDVVAVGGPSESSNSGAIRVYMKLDGLWTIGPEILTGAAGQQIGSKGGLTGSTSGDDIEVVYSTSGGLVRRFDYISGRWGERFTLSTGKDISSLAISKDDGPITVWVGDSSIGEIAEFNQILTPSPTRPLTPEPTVRPTGAPTVSPAPTTETKFPTISPTAFPTGFPEGAGWQVISGPFAGPVPDIGYGASVTMDGTLMATGAPEFSGGVGAVQTFRLTDGWTRMNTVFDRDALSFGAAVDLSVGSTRTSMVVGATQTLDDQDFDLPFGTVHYYEMTGDSWEVFGTPLRPDITPLESNGLFGASVATAADSRRIAVGGPGVSLDIDNIDNGRVYTYNWNGTAFAPLSDPLDGPASGDNFGAAIAMNQNGNRLLIGAPGPEGASSGAIYYYNWDGAEWQLLLPLPGSTDSENLGTSVAIIANDGNTIAVGAPNYETDQGVIRVYRRLNPNELFWDQLGGDIVGEPGEFLGRSLSGFSSQVVAGTATGTFKAFTYNGITSSWTLVDEPPTAAGSVTSIATGSTGDVVVGLESEDVAFYGLF
jgi:hypothetical protein